MTTTPALPSQPLTPNYGIDASSVLRNLLLAPAACFAVAISRTIDIARQSH